jgi:integrase
MPETHPLLRSYRRWWSTTGRSPATGDSYVSVVRRFAETVDLIEATRADLEGFVETRLAVVTDATVSFDCRALRSFYGWLADEGELDVNPAARLRGPKVAERPVPVAAEDDFRRLVASCDPRTVEGRRDAALISLMWYCGIRRGELAALDVGHVDLDESRITLPRTKRGLTRRVPLTSAAAHTLDRWLRKHPTLEGPLFVSQRGGRLTANGIGRMMARRGEATGVQVRSHAFRRSLAVRYLTAGGSETNLRAICGWSDSSASIVRRYTRSCAEDLAALEFRRLLG